MLQESRVSVEDLQWFDWMGLIDAGDDVKKSMLKK